MENPENNQINSRINIKPQLWYNKARHMGPWKEEAALLILGTREGFPEDVDPISWGILSFMFATLHDLTNIKWCLFPLPGWSGGCGAGRKGSSRLF